MSFFEVFQRKRGSVASPLDMTQSGFMKNRESNIITKFSLRDSEIFTFELAVRDGCSELIMNSLVTLSGGSTGTYVANSFLKNIKIWVIPRGGAQFCIFDGPADELREIEGFKQQNDVGDDIWSWGFGRGNQTKWLDSRFEKIRIELRAATITEIQSSGGDRTSGSALFSAELIQTPVPAKTDVLVALNRTTVNIGVQTGWVKTRQNTSGKLRRIWCILRDSAVETEAYTQSVKLVGDSVDRLIEETPVAVLVQKTYNFYKRKSTGWFVQNFLQLIDISKYTNFELELEQIGSPSDFELTTYEELEYNPAQIAGGR